MRCVKCGYRIRNLPAGNCPECDHPFDPANPSTYLIEDAPRLFTQVSSVIAACGVTAWLLAGMFFLLGLQLPAFMDFAFFAAIQIAPFLTIIWVTLFLNWLVQRKKFPD